ncbi:MAG: type II toxin-antitoxin system VapC family toxin [Hormoscilla sp.]
MLVFGKWRYSFQKANLKLTISLHLENYITQKLNLEYFELLTIKLNHLALISTLPFHHQDPFDRLLIAQASIENIPILSRDVAFDAYQINRIWNE